MKQEIINKIRRDNPLIHHLTNQVVMNFTANGLLAFGGSPVMAKSEKEARQIATAADGVLINIGTLTEQELPAMIAAGKAANHQGIPVVLDPVGVSATPFRSESVQKILNQVAITAIKGNPGEMAHLVDIPWQTKGVDSIGSGNVDEIALKAAKTYDTTAIVTGIEDVIHTGNQLISNKIDQPILTKITGAGCLLGSILTACLTTNDPIEKQAETAITFYTLAAQFAFSQPHVSGPGTFLPHFIDALTLDFLTMEGS